LQARLRASGKRFALRPLLDGADTTAATAEHLRAQAKQTTALRVEILNLLQAAAQASPLPARLRKRRNPPDVAPPLQPPRSA